MIYLILSLDAILLLILIWVIRIYSKPLVREYKYESKVSEIVELKLDIDYVKTKQI